MPPTDPPSSEIPPERLSRAELQLMRICAELGTPSVKQITAQTQHSTPRDYNTVYMTFRHMERKGYVERLPGRIPHYRAVVSWEEVLRAEIRIFLDEAIGPENLEILLDEIRAMQAETRPH